MIHDTVIKCKLCETTLTANDLQLTQQNELCNSCRMIKQEDPATAHFAHVRNQIKQQTNLQQLAKFLQYMGILKINTETIILNCNNGGITDIKATNRHK